MSLELTDGSLIEYEAILYGNMTPKMAADYLQQKRVCVRSFSRTLRQMYPGEDLTDRLIDFYQKIRPDIRPSSISKNIRNWLNDHNDPSSREDYFCIAFALGLNEAQLNFLLGMCTDYAIQYRDAKEAVLAWFLRNGCGYSEALDFFRELPVPEQGMSRMEEIFYGEKDPAGSLNNSPEELRSRKQAISRLTHEIRNEFNLVQSKRELRDCYMRNLHRFGVLHMRSYYYFEQYLDLLIRPDSVTKDLTQSYGEAGSTKDNVRDFEELDYSIDMVMKTYLYLQMPSGRSRSNYSLVQKLIKNNWPNSTKLKNIRNRVDDVPRKLLLLLYVVTENSDSQQDYREVDEDYVSLEERVEDHWWTLNALLTECGMAPLDLRNAFDWLILYAICSDGEEAMRDRLESVINELFHSS